MAGKRKRLGGNPPDLTYNAEEVQKLLQKVGEKLDQIVSTSNLSYNYVATQIGMRPDNLYRVRDGDTLPSCETIVNIKSLLPDLDLNWWLFDQGNPELKNKKELEKENAILKKEIDWMRGEIEAIQQRLSTLTNDKKYFGDRRPGDRWPGDRIHGDQHSGDESSEVE